VRPIPIGQTAIFELVVTPEMTVDFEELGPVHPVYATYWMARHMELVGRKILLPFLDPDEEGIGYSVAVRHLAPAAPGTPLRVTGEHVRTERNRIHVRCRVEDATGRLIGEGETIQVVLPKIALAARLRAAAEYVLGVVERTDP